MSMSMSSYAVENVSVVFYQRSCKHVQYTYKLYSLLFKTQGVSNFGTI